MYYSSEYVLRQSSRGGGGGREIIGSLASYIGILDYEFEDASC